MSVNVANVDIAGANVKVVRVGTRQMTLSVFNQIVQEPPFVEWDGVIHPDLAKKHAEYVGWVNYRAVEHSEQLRQSLQATLNNLPQLFIAV